MHLSSLQSAGGSGRSRSHPGGCRKVLRGLRVRGWALDPRGMGQVWASLCTGSAWSPAPGRRRRGEPIPSDALKLVPAWRGGDVSPASVSPWLHLPLRSSAGLCRGQEAYSHTLRRSRAPAPFPSLGCSSFENKILILYGTFLLSQAPKPANSELQALFKTPVG